MPEPYGDVGTIRQQIGETAAMVKFMAEQFNRLEDRLGDDLRLIKGESRQLDQLVTGRLEVMAQKIGQIEHTISQFRDDLKDTKDEVTKIKEPLERLLELRNRVIAYVVAGVSIVAVVWFVLGPFIRSLLDVYAKRLVGG